MTGHWSTHQESRITLQLFVSVIITYTTSELLCLFKLFIPTLKKNPVRSFNYTMRFATIDME